MVATSSALYPEEYFVNGKALFAAKGGLFAREDTECTGQKPTNTLAVERLAYLLTVPGAYFEMLNSLFTKRQVFTFSVHRRLKPALSVTAVISKLEQVAGGDISCVIEFSIP